MQAAVAADEHVARVARIDPHRVMVGLETDVVRAGELGMFSNVAPPSSLLKIVTPSTQMRLSLVGSMYGRAEVHRPRIRAAHLLPRRAGVLGAIRAGLRRMLDERDEDVRIRLRDRERDASLVAGGNAVLELLPRRAAVGRLVDRAARDRRR